MEENQLEGLGSSSLPPPPPPPLSSRREARGSEADPTRVAAPDRDSGEEGVVSYVTTAFHVEVDIFDDARGDGSLRETEVALSGPVVLSGELRDQIVRQVEYYFSDENLPTDSFLLTFIKKDKEGYDFCIIAKKITCILAKSKEGQFCILAWKIIYIALIVLPGPLLLFVSFGGFSHMHLSARNNLAWITG